MLFTIISLFVDKDGHSTNFYNIRNKKKTNVIFHKFYWETVLLANLHIIFLGKQFWPPTWTFILRMT